MPIILHKEKELINLKGKKQTTLTLSFFAFLLNNLLKIFKSHYHCKTLFYELPCEIYQINSLCRIIRLYFLHFLKNEDDKKLFFT